MTSYLRRAAGYAGPVAAAAFTMQLILEAKYQQGWFDAKGCRPEAGCALGRFHSIDYSVIGALVVACFILVGFGRVKTGNALAVGLALLSAAYWLGITS